MGKNQDATYEPSRKAIRGVIAAVVKPQLGGSVTDSWKAVGDAWRAKNGNKTKEEFEEQVKEMSSAILKDVMSAKGRKKYAAEFAFVKKQIGKEAILQEGDSAEPPVRKKSELPEGEKLEQIVALLQELAQEEDQMEKRKLRKKLRRLGHYGGARTDEHGKKIKEEKESKRKSKKAEAVDEDEPATSPRKGKKPAQVEEDSDEDDDDDDDAESGELNTQARVKRKASNG